MRMVLEGMVGIGGAVWEGLGCYFLLGLGVIIKAKAQDSNFFLKSCVLTKPDQIRVLLDLHTDYNEISLVIPKKTPFHSIFKHQNVITLTFNPLSRLLRNRPHPLISLETLSHSSHPEAHRLLQHRQGHQVDLRVARKGREQQ